MERIILCATIDKFAFWLRCEEKSKRTVEKYVRDAMIFALFLSGQCVTKDLVLAFKQRLIEVGYAVRSVNSMLASVNSLLTFLDWPDCKVKTLKIQRDVFCSENKKLTREEYELLCCTARRKKNERLDLIIQAICGTGIRVSELNFITVEAVKAGKAVVKCKGKTRTVLIVKDLQRALLQYIKKRGIKSGPVFVGRGGKPLNRTTIWRQMKALCKDAGVNPQKVFPHNLRHLFARSFYKIEKDIAKLADVLGHSSIETTRIYIISTGEEHLRQMEQMHLIIPYDYEPKKWKKIAKKRRRGRKKAPRKAFAT